MRFLKLLVVTLALTVPNLYAQKISSFRADVELRKDGSAAVTEEVTVEGLAFLQRSLRLEVADGSNSWEMEIKVLTVRDSSGNPLRYETAIRDRHVEILVPLSRPLEQPKTVLLAYEVRHALVVYWEDNSAHFTLNFTDDHSLPLPIEKVLITAIVPADPRGELKAGLSGPSQKPQVTINQRSARLSGEDVPPGYWLRLEASFPSNIVALPMRDWIHQDSVRTLLGCLLVLTLLGALFCYQRTMSADIHFRKNSTHVIIPSPLVTVGTPARETNVRRCSICGSTQIVDSEEFCATCIADRDLLSRQAPPTE